MASMTRSPVEFIHSAMASLAAHSIDTSEIRAYASSRRYAVSERTTVRFTGMISSFNELQILLLGSLYCPDHTCFRRTTQLQGAVIQSAAWPDRELRPTQRDPRQASPRRHFVS